MSSRLISVVDVTESLLTASAWLTTSVVCFIVAMASWK
jgi:hypothetical protein